jgi:aconitate hydratase
LAEVQETIRRSLDSTMFREGYSRIFDGDEQWQNLSAPAGDLYHWDATSTYIQEPPFFKGVALQVSGLQPIRGARVLAMVGDSVTTDHISPAGSISPKGSAGQYLISQGVEQWDFNSFGARRGNHEVMLRGTFGNARLKNLLLGGEEGWHTIKLPQGARTTIYDAAMQYQAEQVPLIVIAGKEYGTGSSRDWAAKGPQLMGVKAVIAESFERIHRSNLVGMGILPLEFKAGQSARSLGLTGRESYDILGFEQAMSPRQEITVMAKREDGNTVTFQALCRVDTAVEVDYYRNGGILPTVLLRLARAS